MPSTFVLRDPRRLARAALAGPGAALTTPAAVMGLSAALPPGPAGIDGITLPLVLLPLVWAALFFQACLDRSLRRRRSGAVDRRGPRAQPRSHDRDGHGVIALPQREHRLPIAIYGWSGVVLGLLLHVVVATGTVAVMAREIGLWSSGALGPRPPLTRPLHAALARVLDRAPPALRDTVDCPPPRPTACAGPPAPSSAASTSNWRRTAASSTAGKGWRRRSRAATPRARSRPS